MKTVVCDDDATLRTVVSRLAEAAGHVVIAETDSAEDAVELVSRFGAGLLVLDLSLPWGSGIRAVRALQAQGSPCHVVVFTAYAADSPELREVSVRAVIEKPHFDQLEQLFAELAAGVVTEGLPAEQERRRTPRQRSRIPLPVVRSPSGLEEPESFVGVLDALEPGDAVLVVHVAPIETAAGPWATLLATDRFLAVAREARAVLRVQDRLAVDEGQLVAILLESGRPGVESAWRRLEAAQSRARIPAVLSGGWAVHEELETPFATAARARDAARRSVGQPPGDRLWAG